MRHNNKSEAALVVQRTSSSVMHRTIPMVPTKGRVLAERLSSAAFRQSSSLSLSHHHHGRLYYKYHHITASRLRTLRLSSCSFFHPLSMSMIAPDAFLRRPWAVGEHDNDNCNRPRILALSGTASKPGIGVIGRLHRMIWQRLKSWWHQACKAWLVAARLSEITLLLTPVALLAPMCLATQSSYLSDLTWRYTISAVQAMGPVAVKFCQWVATRRDIFPPYLCDRLSILHDRGFPHSWHHTQQVLVQAFGDNYQEKGLYIDKEDPMVVIGCGSAAQVYKGTIRTTSTGDHIHNITSTSKAVAVKVLHPQFALAVERDLSLLQTIAEWLHALPSDARG